MKKPGRRLVLLWILLSNTIAFQNCGNFEVSGMVSNSLPSNTFDPRMYDLSQSAPTGASSVTAEIKDVSIVPGDQAIVTVALNKAPTSDLALDFSTSDDTAVAGTHYVASTGTVIVNKNTFSTKITVNSLYKYDSQFIGKNFKVNVSSKAVPSLNRTAIVRLRAVSSPAPANYVFRDKWADLTGSSELTPRYGATAIWTGSKMIVWGGVNISGDFLGNGASYDPETNVWTPISTVGAPSARSNHTAVWTGSKVIVFGGMNGTNYYADGGIYDPASDSWTPLAQSGSIPSGRMNHVAVWTGQKMIVYGGQNLSSYSHDAFGCVAPCSVTSTTTGLNDGGLYDLSTGTWESLPSVGPIVCATAVWTGSVMLVAGGASSMTWTTEIRSASDSSSTLTSVLYHGLSYNPASKQWSNLNNIDLVGLYRKSVWTGTKMLLLGGVDSQFQALSKSMSFDPVTQKATGIDFQFTRFFSDAVWTGTSVIAWGGATSNGKVSNYYNNAGIYY